MTPGISLPSSYLDPKTNEYREYSPSERSSDEEPGSSHHLSQYQVPRITRVSFVALSKPKHTCARDLTVSPRKEEWGLATDAVGTNGGPSNDVLSGNTLFSQKDCSSSSNPSDPPSSSSSGNSGDPGDSGDSGDSSSSSDSGYVSYASSSNSSESSSSDEDDLTSHISFLPLTRRWSWPARPRLDNRAAVRYRAAEVAIGRRTKSLCGTRLG
ncbi:hypothetical protein PMIN06_008206 [Paraphaeosphaeria minitans]